MRIRIRLLLLSMLLGLAGMIIWDGDVIPPRYRQAASHASAEKSSSHSYSYYYRKHDGWLQKRLYDRTSACWMEPEWQNVKALE